MIEVDGLGSFEARKPNAAGLRILLESIDLQSVDDLLAKMRELSEPDESDEEAGSRFLNVLAGELGGIARALERVGPAVFCAFARPHVDNVGGCADVDPDTLCMSVAELRPIMPFDAPLQILNEAAEKGILASIAKTLGNSLSLLPKTTVSRPAPDSNNGSNGETS